MRRHIEALLSGAIQVVIWENRNFRSRGLTVQPRRAMHWVAMQVQTKFLRLFKGVALGDRIDGWRVCWIGGWDKCRVVFVVMVEKRISANGSPSE